MPPAGGRLRAGPPPAGLFRAGEIDEDTGPTFVLRGRVVTMDDHDRVHDSARVVVERGHIARILLRQRHAAGGLCERPAGRDRRDHLPGTHRPPQPLRLQRPAVVAGHARVDESHRMAARPPLRGRDLAPHPPARLVAERVARDRPLHRGEGAGRGHDHRAGHPDPGPRRRAAVPRSHAQRRGDERRPAARGRHARPQPRPAGRGLRGVPGEPRQAGRGRGRVLLPPGRRHERARPPDLHRPAGSRPPAAGARRDPLACADRRRPPAPGRAQVARRLVAVQQPAALRADPRPAGADRGRRAVQPGLRLVANRQQEPARGAQGRALRGTPPGSRARRQGAGRRRHQAAGGGPRLGDRGRIPGGGRVRRSCSSCTARPAIRTRGSWTRSSPTSRSS